MQWFPELSSNIKAKLDGCFKRWWYYKADNTNIIMIWWKKTHTALTFSSCDMMPIEIASRSTYMSYKT